jgi:hypothetical protein
MAMLSDELAAAGRGGDWMRVLAANGDIAAEWVWKNRGTIGVATAASAFLANPEAFLTAGEHVAVKTVEAITEHVARPLVEEVVAKPALAVAEAAGSQLWLLAPLAGGGAFVAYRYARSRMQRQS